MTHSASRVHGARVHAVEVGVQLADILPCTCGTPLSHPFSLFHVLQLDDWLMNWYLQWWKEESRQTEMMARERSGSLACPSPVPTAQLQLLSGHRYQAGPSPAPSTLTAVSYRTSGAMSPEMYDVSSMGGSSGMEFDQRAQSAEGCRRPTSVPVPPAGAGVRMRAHSLPSASLASRPATASIPGIDEEVEEDMMEALGVPAPVALRRAPATGFAVSIGPAVGLGMTEGRPRQEEILCPGPMAPMCPLPRAGPWSMPSLDSSVDTLVADEELPAGVSGAYIPAVAGAGAGAEAGAAESQGVGYGGGEDESMYMGKLAAQQDSMLDGSSLGLGSGLLTGSFGLGMSYSMLMSPPR